MKSRVHLRYKTRYRVGNWPEYERALVQRGDITLWLSADAIAAWTPAPTGRRGGQRKFSNHAIETALMLRLVFGLPLRQAEGFLRSLLSFAIYEAAAVRGATVVIPPTKTAVMSRRRPRSSARDRTIIRVQKIGRRRWKKETSYHRQPRAENVFFRYKSIIGDRLRARHSRAQAVEAMIACNILNQMTELGRPASIAIGR